MKYELFATNKLLLNLGEHCESIFFNTAFEEIETHTTSYSNFWEISPYFLSNSNFSHINKIQIVSLFIVEGGIVKFDGHLFTRLEHKLWDYMLEHKYITESEYDLLDNNFLIGGRVSLILP